MILMTFYYLKSILKFIQVIKGVKGQVYKDAPIELKINWDDPYDLVDMLKYFEIDSRSLKGYWTSITFIPLYLIS